MVRRDSLKRRMPFREPLPRILVVCEGEVTEHGYFEHLGRLYRRFVRVEVDSKGGSNPKKIVERAVGLKKESDRQATAAEDENLRHNFVWCVFDVDDHHRIPDALQQARDNGIDLAISNPCFELWILLHFQDHRKDIRRKDLQSLVRKHLPGYLKDVPCDRLTPLYEHATTRASNLESWHAKQGRNEHPNPSTGVYKLTEQIRKFDHARG
jgi:hypothetical protein